jgi:hypothetical protein
MADTIKKLGGAAGNGVIGTAATLVTCPSATSVVISQLTVCNAGATARTFTIAVHTGTSYSAGSYVVYQMGIAAGDTYIHPAGITLDATNKYLLVSSSHADVNFSAFGMEVT